MTAESNQQSEESTMGNLRDKPMMVGKKATIKLCRIEEYYVDVEMPVDGDPARQAGLYVFSDTPSDDYETVHAEVLDEEPLYEDDFESEEDWPRYE